MHSIISRRLVAVGITAAAVAVSGAPSAHAVSKTDKKQNSAIKKVAKAGKKINKKAGAAKTAANAAAAAAAAANKKGTDAGTSVVALSTKVDGVVATATAALTQLSDGLKQVAAGLQTAGAGLTKLSDFVGADEYGIVSIGQGASNTAIPGCFYETGNIPDNLQDAIVSGTCLIPDAVTAGSPLHINAGIRSNEVDGVANGNAAGVAGIVAYQQTNITTVDKNGTVNSQAVNVPAGGGATVPSGSGQPPAVTIPLKSPPTSMTETTFAFAPISTDVLVDLATTQFAGTPATPLIGAGTGRSISFTIRFNDLTSAADNAKE